MATQIKDNHHRHLQARPRERGQGHRQIEELIHEGNVRRVIVKDAGGVTLIEVPLTFGLIGAALVPVWAAIAAIAAIAADFTIQVERKEPTTP
jgi:hypothetical protein